MYSNLSNILEKKFSKDKSIFRAVECGTGARSANLIVKLMNKYKFKTMSFEAYDNFEGLPFSADNPDPNLLGLYKKTLKQFEIAFKKYHFVSAVKGLIPESLPKDDDKSYDFIYIDLDLYEGTKESLRHFLPRLNIPEIIQLDDYNNIPWTGVNKAVDEYLATIDQESFFLIPIALGGAFIIKK